MRMPRNGRGLHHKIDANSLSAWHFDETSTTSTVDKVGNNRTLAVVGALALPSITTGRVGNAFAFNGSTQVIGRSITTSADQNLGLGECTLAIAFRMTAAPFNTDQILFRIGGPTDNETLAFNETFCARVVRGALSTDAPLLNFRWESGAGVDQPSAAGASLTTVPLLVGQTYVAHFIKKTNGANFDMIIGVNGRITTVGTNLPQTTPGSADLGGTNRILVGASVNAAVAIVNPAAVQVCSALFSNRAYTENECAEDFRRVAGYALPTSLHSRVWLANQSDVMVNMSAPASVQDDMLTALSVTDSTDAPCASSNVTLSTLVGDLSIGMQRSDSKLNNPTQAGSFTPFLDPFRRIDIECARVPHWLDPVSTDWWIKQRGRTDAITEDSESVSVESRDQGGYLQDKYGETLIVYPRSFGGGGCGGSAQAREIVVEEILQDNLEVIAFAPFNERSYFTPALPAEVLGTNTAVWVPFPSSSCVLPMREGQAPELRDVPLPRGRVMDSLRQMAASIGWEFNFKRWDPLLEQFRPCMFDPNALQVAPDFVISADDLIETQSAKISLENTRNRVTVNFPNSATKDANDNPLPGSSTRLDTDNSITSRSRYGTRGMDMTEDAGSNINTAAEATRLADNVIQALALPLRDSSQQIVALPEIDAGDLAYFIADGVDSTSNQASAVQSYSFATSAQESTTSIECEGKPKAGKTRFLDFEAGKTGKNPMRNPSEAIQQKGMGTLLPAFMSMVDRTNWLSTAKFINVKNGDFNRFSRGDAYPPDSWSVDAGGVWNPSGFAVRGVKVSAVDQRSGNRAIVLQPGSVTSSNAALSSQMFAVDGDSADTYSFSVVWKYDVLSSADPHPVTLRVDWYDAAKTLLTSVDAGWTAGVHLLSHRGPIFTTTARTFETFKIPAAYATAGVWHTSRVDGVRPPSGGLARFMRVSATTSVLIPGDVGVPATIANTAGTVVDSVSVHKTANSLLSKASVNNASVAAAFTCVRFDTVNIGKFFDYGGNLHANGFAGTGYGFICQRAGRYKVESSVTLTAAASVTAALRLTTGATYLATGAVNAAGTTIVNGTTSTAVMTKANAGIPLAAGGVNACAVVLAGYVDLSVGQVINVEVRTSAAATIVKDDGAALTRNVISQFSVELVAAQ